MIEFRQINGYKVYLWGKMRGFTKQFRENFSYTTIDLRKAVENSKTKESRIILVYDAIGCRLL